MNTLPILTIITLLPLLGGIIVIRLPAEQRRGARGLGLVRSVGMLLAFLATSLSTDRMDCTQLADLGRNGTLASALSVKLGWGFITEKWLARVIFAAVFLGFAVKVPLIPFHTWLPSAYA